MEEEYVDFKSSSFPSKKEVSLQSSHHFSVNPMQCVIWIVPESIYVGFLSRLWSQWTSSLAFIPSHHHLASSILFVWYPLVLSHDSTIPNLLTSPSHCLGFLHILEIQNFFLNPPNPKILPELNTPSLKCCFSLCSLTFMQNWCVYVFDSFSLQPFLIGFLSCLPRVKTVPEMTFENFCINYIA